MEVNVFYIHQRNISRAAAMYDSSDNNIIKLNFNNKKLISKEKEILKDITERERFDLLSDDINDLADHLLTETLSAHRRFTGKK